MNDRSKVLEELHKSVSPLQHKEEVENKEETREEASGVRIINMSKKFKEFRCCQRAREIDAVQKVNRTSNFRYIWKLRKMRSWGCWGTMERVRLHLSIY